MVVRDATAYSHMLGHPGLGLLGYSS